jgi:hypothetical protein
MISNNEKGMTTIGFDTLGKLWTGTSAMAEFQHSGLSDKVVFDNEVTLYVS